MKIISCIFLIIVSQNLLAQGTEENSSSKWSMNMETALIPVSSFNSTKLNCYQGSLGIDYKLLAQFRLGIFGQTLLYHQNTDIANIDSKIIELGSIEYNSLGLSISYVKRFNKIQLIPKLDTKYDFLVAKSIDFADDKTSFIDYRYITLHPKLNVGYHLSETFIIGLSVGYNKQILALKGHILDEFNPNSITIGCFGMIFIK